MSETQTTKVIGAKPPKLATLLALKLGFGDHSNLLDLALRGEHDVHQKARFRRGV